MRTRLFLAVAATTMAISGVVQAGTIITETLTGTVTSGLDGGLNGANDSASLFGGGNLSGTTLTVSFSYDIDALNAAAISAINGSSYTLDPSVYDFYYDVANDGALTQSITVGSQTYTQTNNTGFSGAEIEDCSVVSCEGPSLLINTTNLNSGQFILFDFSSGSSSISLPLGQLGNQTAIQGYLSETAQSGTAQSGTIVEISNATNTAADSLYVTISGVSDAPEPMTWGSVAIGIGSMAMLKRRRRFNKFSR